MMCGVCVCVRVCVYVCVCARVSACDLHISKYVLKYAASMNSALQVISPAKFMYISDVDLGNHFVIEYNVL